MDKIKISTLGPVGANLTKKGMVYSPSRGEMAFTAPLFDEVPPPRDAGVQQVMNPVSGPSRSQGHP